MTWQAALGHITPEHVAQAAARWGAAHPQVVNLGCNHVYRATLPDGALALRLTHASLRSPEFLTPPLAYLRHAWAAGAGVCEPLASRSGAWIEALHGGVLATAVRWVPGPRVSDLPPTPALYQALGRAIAELHSATRSVAPPADAVNMFDPGLPGVFPSWRWFWDRAAASVRAPALERHWERLSPLVAEWGGDAGCWPRSAGGQTVNAPGFGLTHGDLRPGNAIWTGERVVIIDFDEPVYGPLTLDLARAGLELSPAQRQTLMPALLAGYRTVMPLDPVWEARLPLLRQMRAALMAAWMLGGGDGNGGDSEEAAQEGSGAVVSVPRLLEMLEQE